MKKIFLFSVIVTLQLNCSAQSVMNADLKTRLDALADVEITKVIEWRRDIHEHPELSNREVRTGALVADHLKKLGLEVKTGVAKTGVIGILRGGKPGPVIALRADMDALPVTERTDVPFKSIEKVQYNGASTGVMHACGHDGHTAILMGVAEVLSQVKNDIAGTIVFLFQPAEEGAPKGEAGGACEMVKAGCLENPKVEACFGLHVDASGPVGTIEYRPGGFMASSDAFSIVIKGKQTHGAMPWGGIDPIVIGAQIVNGLQTIVSRMTPLTETPAVVTVGSFNAGNRGNIIPEEARMTGTIRCFDKKIQYQIHENIRRMATNIAEASGATAVVEIDISNPVTYNNPDLTAKMVPTFEEVAGKNKTMLVNAVTGAEDFAKYAEVVPSLFFDIGVRPVNKKMEEAAPHHTPDFYMDESGFILGLKTFCHIVVDYAAKK